MTDDELPTRSAFEALGPKPTLTRADDAERVERIAASIKLATHQIAELRETADEFGAVRGELMLLLVRAGLTRREIAERVELSLARVQTIISRAESRADDETS